MDIGLKRGLRKFINDIRNCSSKGAEEERVQKELVNVRLKFSTGKNLKSYDKKKYVWKLVYIFMLGYDVDFGHMEAVNLASSQDPSEKHVGYIALGVLLGNNSDLAKLVVNSIRTDLQSKEVLAQSLALNLLANIGGKDLTDSLAGDVLRLFESESLHPSIRKKAALCLLAMLRVSPDIATPEEVVKVALPTLNQTLHLGLTLSLLTLVYRLAQKNPAPFTPCVTPVVGLLEKVVVLKAVPEQYYYHEVPCPLLQVFAYKFLQLYEIPEESHTRNMIIRVLKNALNVRELTEDPNRMNAFNAVLIEGVNVVTHYGDIVETDLLEKSISHLAHVIASRDPNVRYLGLASMSKLAQTAHRDGLTGILAMIRNHQPTVKESLRDSDYSIRKKSLDLMFAMCDEKNAKEVVSEMLAYLSTVSFVMKEETVLKIAILAERYASDFRWYLDVILHLIAVAGDYVADDIWYRAIQIVANHADLQVYAARKMYDVIQPSHTHETAIKVGTYILGEYGHVLVEPSADVESVQVFDIFEAINQHFATVSNSTRSMMFHAYLKLMHRFPEELREEVSLLLDAYRDASDPELQQRACEYYELSQLDRGNPVVTTTLQAMPAFPQDRVSAVVRALEQASLGDDTVNAGKISVSLTGSTTATKTTPPQAEIEAQTDLLGLGDEDSGDSLTEQPAAPVSRIKQWYCKCLQEPKGLLYEDGFVQIGLQHQYEGEIGKMMVFIGNKTGQMLDELTLAVPTSPSLVVTLAPCETFVAPGSQARLPVALSHMIPFEEGPSLKLSFRGPSGMQAITLKLPVSVCNFAQPVFLDAPDFDQKWNAMGDKAQSSFTLSSLGPGALDLVIKTMNALHFGTFRSEDLSTVCGSTTIQTGTVNPRTQTKAVVGCLTRVLLAGQSCNVAVRAMNHAVVANVKTALLDILSSSNK